MFITTDQDSDKSFAILREAFGQIVDNPMDYELVYGYRTKTRYYIVVTINKIYHYLFAHTKAMTDFVVCPIAVNGDNNYSLGDPIKFKADDIISFKKSIMGNHNLKLKNGTNLKMTFPPYTIKGSYQITVKQKEAVQTLTSFAKNIGK